MRITRERIYRIGPKRYMTIVKDWSMKYGQYLYHVREGIGPMGKSLLVASFAEARQFVREAACK